MPSRLLQLLLPLFREVCQGRSELTRAAAGRSIEKQRGEEKDEKGGRSVAAPGHMYNNALDVR